MPLVVSWFIRVYNWRWSLVFMSGIILVCTVLAAILLRNDPRDMGLSPYGADNKVHEKVSAKTHFKTISVSLKQALRTREFWLLAAVLFCYGFCFVAYQVHIVVHAIDVGVSSNNAALIITIMGGATIVGQLGLGGIGDRLGNKRAFVFGLGCILAAVSLIAFAREFWYFGVFAVLMGLAFGDCSTQESPIVAWLFGLGSHGTILGVFAFAFTCGAALGPLVFGAIYDARGSYQLASYISIILAVVALFLASFLKRSSVQQKV